MDNSEPYLGGDLPELRNEYVPTAPGSSGGASGDRDQESLTQLEKWQE